MSEQRPKLGTAFTLGIFGAIAAGTGIVIALTPNASLTTPIVGVLIRVGAVLLAVSFAIPLFRKPSGLVMTLLGAGLVVVLIRPALIWAAVIGWIGWTILGRQRSTDDNDS